MTADAITGVEEECRRVGIDFYISKPFEPEQFVATIWNALKPLHEERQNRKRAEVMTKEIAAAFDIVLDEQDGIRRLGNNTDLYLMVLDEYYHENRDVLPLLTSSINERRYQDAIQIVHKIKSSSGNIGAKRLSAISSELQQFLVNEDET